METSKTYVFNPEGSGNNGGMMSLIAPLLQQRGVDPNVLLAMKGNNRIRQWRWLLVHLAALYPLLLWLGR